MRLKLVLRHRLVLSSTNLELNLKLVGRCGLAAQHGCHTTVTRFSDCDFDDTRFNRDLASATMPNANICVHPGIESFIDKDCHITRPYHDPLLLLASG